MALISLVGAGRDHGLRRLFAGLDLHVGERERIGLIGPNGAGKSTLLRALAGQEPLDEGERRCSARLKVVLLDQDPQLDPGCSVLEAVFAGGGERMELLRAHEQTSHALAGSGASAQEALLARLSDLQRRIEAAGAWELEQNAQEVLQRLGLGGELLHRRVAELSGGNRRRVALAAALLAQPEVLLLDEPTNHLDAIGVEWLQTWLDRYAGAVVLVTHDRYLLDRVTRRIIAVEGGEARRYEGNYATYLQQRAEQDASEVAAAARLRGTLRRELAWMRQGPKARSTKQKARLQRIAALQETPLRQGRGQLNLASAARRIGKRVISAEGLAVRAGSDSEGPLLLQDFSHDFGPEDRVGIIGPNGVGKSSLLEVIAGRRAPAAGRLELGATVQLAYFDQHSAVLGAGAGGAGNLDRKVIDVVLEAASRVTIDGQEISASQLLERFLFPPAQQHQPVARLSGGERRRLHLCRLLIGAPNLLLLDEPTNDLDVQTLSVLEEFLEDFRGCVLVVSHDRWFLDRCVDRLFVFEAGRLERFEGNYSAYLEQTAQREARREARPAAAPAPRGSNGAAASPGNPISAGGSPASSTGGSPGTGSSSRKPNSSGPRRRSFRESRELETIERELPAWEGRRLELETLLAQPGGSDYDRIAALSEELADLLERIAAAEERWLTLSELAG